LYKHSNKFDICYADWNFYKTEFTSILKCFYTNIHTHTLFQTEDQTRTHANTIKERKTNIQTRINTDRNQHTCHHTFHLFVTDFTRRCFIVA
jgi:hypothetical protein